MLKLFRKVNVRGLCSDSTFDSLYLYNINAAGKVLYLGKSSSFLIYDNVIQRILYWIFSLGLKFWDLVLD